MTQTPERVPWPQAVAYIQRGDEQARWRDSYVNRSATALRRHALEVERALILDAIDACDEDD